MIILRGLIFGDGKTGIMKHPNVNIKQKTNVTK